MDRSHLIARTFGGTSDLENIVALYKAVNQAMKRVEYEIRRRLDRNERVFVAVKPIYQGEELVPSAIMIIINSASGLSAAGIKNTP